MSKGVRISKTHGLNPTIGICVFCGKETGEIALLGLLPQDTEAPKYSILSYEPCDECKKGMALGVTFIAVTKEPKIKDQPSIKKTEALYPTGQVLVFKEDSQICVDNNLKTGDKILCEIELFDKMVSDIKSLDKE